MTLKRSLFALSLLTFFALASLAPAAETSAKKPQIILLKLDDITPNGAPKGQAMSPRWQRLVDFLEKNDIRAGLGIIGHSLEDDNALYFDWIKNLHKKGRFEFWNHGYRNRKADDKAGEFEGSFEEQKTALEKTQKLAKEKLGIDLVAFGPHWSGTNADTDKALEAVPGLKVWLYGPKKPAAFTKLSIERVLALENPTFVPDFEKFQTLYEKNAATREVLVLQGHPNAWTDQRWEGFVKIIDFLKSKNCVFMTPSQYLKSLEDKPK